jgi:acyl-CoA thioesterase I
MLPAMPLSAPSYRALAGATVVSTALVLAACRPSGPPQPKAGEPGVASAAAPAEAPPRADLPAVVFLGDSLTAGYGLSEEQAYPALLEARMHEAGLRLPVVNAGVSGDTTAGGLSRLDWILRQKVAVLVVALGANDGLRGVPLEETRRNLSRIVERARAAGAQVILAGMRLPVNYGPQYRSGFERIYADLARRYGVPVVPFLLEGVGGVARLNQADGIHPTAEGQRIIADVVWPVLEPLVREVARRA